MGSFIFFALVQLILILGFVSIFYLHFWYTNPWQRPFAKPTYIPSLKSLWNLTTLIHILGEVHLWLGPGNNPIVQGLEHKLWESISYLQQEKEASTAIFSSNREEAIWALRRLSKQKSRVIIKTIQSIFEHQKTSASVRELAQDILRKWNKDNHSQKKHHRKAPSSPPKRSTNPLVYYPNQMTVNTKEITMSKTENKTTNNIGQANIVGDNAHAENTTMVQLSNQNNNGIENTEALLHELEILRLELKKQATTPEQDIAVGAIAAAEIEIKNGNSEKAKSLLKQAGSWAFDVATKIGIGVATAALKTALGF